MKILRHTTIEKFNEINFDKNILLTYGGRMKPYGSQVIIDRHSLFWQAIAPVKGKLEISKDNILSIGEEFLSNNVNECKIFHYVEKPEYYICVNFTNLHCVIMKII